MRWMEDHGRKLFWALWLPAFGVEADWRTIPKYMELANGIHETRLRTLYFDPADSRAQEEITGDVAARLISLTDTRLEMERLKKYRELDEQERSDMQWFFLASRNPEMKPFIFSKPSMEKQIETQDKRNAWIRWLRGQFEDSERKAMELARQEMSRQRPDGEERFADKWKLRIRIRSWSHSIRPNQLTAWNKAIDKIKLVHTKDKRELIVEFTMGKNVLMQDLWGFGMQSSLIFMVSLNISTGGFFWWYLPTFVSRFYESITDLDTDHQVIVERVPELRISWGPQVLKEEDLVRHLPLIFGYIARATEEQQKFYHRYFGALGMMAKSDLFFQFEHNLSVEFMECLYMALQSYGDWNGNSATLDSILDKAFERFSNSPEFMEMVRECVRVAISVKTQTFARPITLDDVAKAKIAFDMYIRLKAEAYVRSEIAKGNIGPILEEPDPG